MLESKDRPSSGVRAGSPTKREAIRATALALFARDGFTRTSVDAVASEAGVSKRTVYDYYGDKDRLFLEVLEQSAANEDRRFAELVARTLGGEVTDLRRSLVSFGREFALGVTSSIERQAVVRLMITEAPHFPELLTRWRAPSGAQHILADALAQLAGRDLLDISDPQDAAAQLGVLVTARIAAHTLYGAVPIAESDLDRFVESGVSLFLLAYGRLDSDPSQPHSPTTPRQREARERDTDS